MSPLRRTQNTLYTVFAILAIGALVLIPRLRFAFDFEQFFPINDPDLQYYQDFIKEFESDDNFVLVALERPEGLFDSIFLNQVNEFSLAARDLPYVTRTQSLTRMKMPMQTPFGLTAVPVLHIDQPEFYASDSASIMRDERFKYNMISEDGHSLLVYLQTNSKMDLADSEIILDSLNTLINQFGFKHHYEMGRPTFQVALVDITKEDVAISAIFASIFVSLILWLIFRSWRTNLIALGTLGVALLLFLGLMAAFGRELSPMSALYPVLLVIIGTSDMMHLMSKYLDELGRGKTREEARSITIREIGLATFMTAITTAVGFATLVTSRVRPIQEFGINAAVGVMVAYITSVLLGMALLSQFEKHELQGRLAKSDAFWDRIMRFFYLSGKNNPRRVVLISSVLMAAFLYGCSIIKTNYNIESMLPMREKVTTDFKFFEEQYAGYRPIEFAVETRDGLRADSYSVLKTLDSIEKQIKTNPSIKSVTSVTSLYKSAHQIKSANHPDSMVLPYDSLLIADYAGWVDKMPKTMTNVLINESGDHARISVRIKDLGADSVMATGDRILDWIATNTDSNQVQIKRTGTGYVLDKNAMYVRGDLIEGLLLEIGLIALLMGLVLRNVRMIIIFLIPNLFPLFFAGAAMGFLGINLDAGISMVFTVVFGIAIDDTIHFLSSFQLNRRKGMTVEKAIETTTYETGKPVLLTTIILFVGFLIMLGSRYPPTHTVGILIAITLISALLSDLYLNPLLIRWLLKDKPS
jgi:uncharacterized protein